MEYYSPILQANDRTDRAVHLMAGHPFVIADVHDIFNKEEENYPAILKTLPFRLNSADVLDHHSAEEKSQILFQMLHHGIPDVGYNLAEWTLRNNEQKKDWPDHVDNIIKHAEEKFLIKSKSKFLESHNLRFCWQIVDAIEKLDNPALQDKNFKRSIHKLAQMRERKDT
jgi:hypothetical protein